MVLAGALWGEADLRNAASQCRLRIPDGRLEVRGSLETAPMVDPGAEVRGRQRLPFRMIGSGDTCRGRIHAVFRNGGDASPAPPVGRTVRLEGRWRPAPRPDPLRAEWAGELEVEGWAVAPEGILPDAPVLRLRGGVQHRLRRLLPAGAPLAEALILARREGLDPEVRDAFSDSGTAHLLAISGFHVGVIAGLLLVLLRVAGVERGRVLPLAVGGTWAYVAAIGAPDAAVRACAMLSCLAAGRMLGRKVAPLGALGTAFLLLLVLDPGALSRAGFQLSFAGAAGLAVLGPPIRRGLERIRPPWAPRGPIGPIAAGVAATAATAPLVAWHFGRLAPASIPATLLAAPLVSLAIPALLGLLFVDLLPGFPAAFLGGGVELLLELLVRVVGGVASVPGASVPVSRPGLLALGGAVGAGGWVLRRLRRERSEALRTNPVRGGRRAAGPGRTRLLPALLAGSAVALALPVVPPLLLPPTLEVVVLDVGQGDAILLGSPRGRWVLVDAGPRSPGWDAGERRILPYLRRRGIGRLEAVVLTHPDMDHIGGALAVLGGVEVGAVIDPARVTGKAAWVDLLDLARSRGVGWARAGDARRLSWDGVDLEVLHPPAPGPGADAGGGGVANDDSVVLLLRWGRFRALLTGDAPAEVEEAVLGRIDGPVHLLKVGHHGSLTSTSAALLDRARPEIAVIPVGSRNRYGHPHPRVLARLHDSGARIFRTDRDGTVVVRVDADGAWRVALPDRPRGLRARAIRRREPDPVLP